MCAHQERTKGRKTAVQVLYSSELTGVSPLDIVATGNAPEEVVLDEYAMMLLQGVAETTAELDAILNAASSNWTVQRMPIVDKCILRLAVYEMLHVDQVPTAVAINEAVDLAKDFGGEDESHRFVNGVLGRIAQRIADGETLTAAAEPEAAEAAPAAPEAAVPEVAPAAPAVEE